MASNMERIAFKVNDNGKKIVQCLNHFTKSASPMPMYGDAGRDSYYCIDYDPKAFQMKAYLWADNPGGDAIIKDILPPFMNLPLDIQVEIVSRARYNSPVPFLLNASNDYSHGGFNWYCGSKTVVMVPHASSGVPDMPYITSHWLVPELSVHEAT